MGFILIQMYLLYIQFGSINERQRIFELTYIFIHLMMIFYRYIFSVIFLLHLNTVSSKYTHYCNLLLSLDDGQGYNLQSVDVTIKPTVLLTLATKTSCQIFQI